MFGTNMPGMGGGMPGGGDGFGFELPEGIGGGSIGGAGAGGTGMMPGGVYGGLPAGGLGGAGADGMSAKEAGEWGKRALATSTHSTFEDLWDWLFLTDEEKEAKKKALEKKKKEQEAGGNGPEPKPTVLSKWNESRKATEAMGSTNPVGQQMANAANEVGKLATAFGPFWLGFWGDDSEDASD